MTIEYTFRKSKRKHKKYDAILHDTNTGKTKIISFGDTRFLQYKDSTGLGLYSHLDHNDKERRKLYRIRHYKTHFKKYSPSWWSWHFLW